MGTETDRLSTFVKSLTSPYAGDSAYIVVVWGHVGNFLEYATGYYAKKPMPAIAKKEWRAAKAALTMLKRRKGRGAARAVKAAEAAFTYAKSVTDADYMKQLGRGY